MQDVGTAHVGHFGRVVSILNTGLRSGQVVHGAVQVVDNRIETVLYRTQGRTQAVNLCQRFVQGSQWIFNVSNVSTLGYNAFVVDFRSGVGFAPVAASVV